jgi:nitroreductase
MIVARTGLADRLVAAAGRCDHAGTAFQEPREVAALTAAGGLRPAALEDVLLDRVSVREWDQRPVAGRVLRGLAELATATAAQLAPSVADRVLVRPLLVVRRGDDNLPAGCWLSSGGELIAAGPPPDAEQARAIVLQGALALAPATIVLLADLDEALSVRGPRGYRDALVVAGAVGGRLWLAIEAEGLGGCMSAGIIEAGVRDLVDIDGYRACPVTLVGLGHPRARPSL